MKKMMEQHRKFMKNNKGFSLVELIIVIAIMAVLVAVLAPQYTKYVEKSRQSTDVSAADSILGACKTIAIDPEYYDKANVTGGFSVTWSAGTTGAGAIACSDGTELQSAIQDLVGSNVAPKSKDFTTVTFTYHPAVAATTGTNATAAVAAYFSVTGPTYITDAKLAPTA